MEPGSQDVPLGTQQHPHQTRPPPRPPRAGRLPPYLMVTAGGTTILFGYCYYRFLDVVPFTNRKRWIATSPEWESHLGHSEYRKLLSQFRSDVLPPSHRATMTVERVGARIAAASSQFAQQNGLPHASNPFTYTVVRSDMANAFVLPGNHIFVMTGLFRYVQNEDDLAAVLGHEAAHNIARHAGEKISGSFVTNLLARLSLLIDPSGLLLTFFLPAATVLHALPHSHVQEAEADAIGLQLAAQACYDPTAAQRVFGAMITKAQNTAEPPAFLSTHPSHEARVSKLQDWMPQALQVYQRDNGLICERVRRDMELARQEAARQLAAGGASSSVAAGRRH